MKNLKLKQVKMQKWLWVLGIITLVGVVPRTARADKDDCPERTLAVSGQAEVKVAPDRARVTIGAEAQESDASEATARVNTIINAALKEIKKLGIKDKAIQTTRINLYPIYENLKSGDPGPAKIVGYRATNSVQVTVDELSLVGKVLDAANEAGANRQNGVSFELKNDAEAKAEALKLAAQEARAKAQTLANALGVRLVAIKSVNENNTSVIMPRPLASMAMYKSASADTSVQAGEMTVQAGVSLVYVIE